MQFLREKLKEEEILEVFSGPLSALKRHCIEGEEVDLFGGWFYFVATVHKSSRASAIDFSVELLEELDDHSYCFRPLSRDYIPASTIGNNFS